MKSQTDFLPSERRILSRLNSPRKIQDFLDDLDANLEETDYSPRNVMANRKADCLEGALFAATALRFHGSKPLILSTSSVRDDDHVVALFKKDGHWGAISKSKYTGLSYREPIHRSLRELAVSYFEGYFNHKGEKTLRGYCRPVNLEKFDDRKWMTTLEPITFIETYLQNLHYRDILRHGTHKSFRRVTSTMINAGEVWLVEKGILGKVKEIF